MGKYKSVHQVLPILEVFLIPTSPLDPCLKGSEWGLTSFETFIFRVNIESYLEL